MAKKTRQFHVTLEESKINMLKGEAQRRGISAAELARRKLEQDVQLDRIEKRNEDIFTQIKLIGEFVVSMNEEIYDLSNKLGKIMHNNV